MLVQRIEDTMQKRRRSRRRSNWLLAPLGLALLAGLVSVAIAAGPTYPKPEGYVNDFAGALAPDVRQRLEQTLQAVDEQFQVQVTIATTNDIGDEDPTEYANRLYEAWRVGNKKTNRGILLLDVIGGPGHSFFRVEVGYGLEGVLPDGRVGRILDESVMPLLRDGDRANAYTAAVRELLAPVLREMKEDPEQLNALLEQSGWTKGHAAQRNRLPFPPKLILILIFILISIFGRRRRRGLYLGGPFGGGFGGFGSFGGGGGGGFGGFGGGLSGGGGAGRGY